MLIATRVSLLLGPLGGRAGLVLICKKIKCSRQLFSQQPLRTDPSLQPTGLQSQAHLEGLMSIRISRERTYEVTSSYADPLPVSTTAHRGAIG